MATPSRSDRSKSGKKVQPLNVAPLNSVPYVGPPLHPDTINPPTRGDSENEEAVGAAMVFLPPNSAKEELDGVLAATKNGVVVTGSAATGKIGPVLGAYDIVESFDSYYFRVALPGVSRDEKDFSCDIEPDGNITVKGVTRTGEKVVCKHSQVFKMQSQNLCPPGHFSVSFPLPGSVNHLQFNCNFINGILEGTVKKR